tara:strand:- start:3904 stop:4818 length:915 start_codon:yes stop_codon:yes gene_type:complete
MILVTGVAGFIGAKVAESLIEAGETIVGVDDLSTSDLSNVPNDVIFENFDLADTQLVSKLEKHGNFKTIYHIAGQSGGEPSYDNPLQDLNSNTASTLNLLQLALKSPDCVFVYASTVSVYGKNGKTHLQNEHDLCRPESFYGVGKVASENYLRIYAEQYGLKTRSLRLFNIYGPGQNLNNLRQGMVSIFIAQAINNGEIIVKGSSDRYRDFVYIDDAVTAFKLASDYLASGYFVFNISTGIKTTVKEVCSLIGDVPVKYSNPTPGDVHGYTGDFSRAKDLLGWVPKTSFSDGIAKMLEWANNQQ